MDHKTPIHPDIFTYVCTVYIYICIYICNVQIYASIHIIMRVYIYMAHIYTHDFCIHHDTRNLKPSYVRGTTGSAGNTALAVSVAESWLEEIQLGKTMPFMGEYH